MEDGSHYIELKIEFADDPDLLDFTAVLGAVGNHFRDWVYKTHPELEGRAFLKIERIGHGCIFVHLAPAVLPLIQHMDYFLIVDGFVQRLDQIKRYFRREVPKPPDTTATEMQSVIQLAHAIARNPKNKATISSLEYHATEKTKRFSVEFDGNTAREIAHSAPPEVLAIDLTATYHEPREHVLMRFEQSNIKKRRSGSKNTGDRVVIDKIDQKSFGLIYGSDLARERIRDEKLQFGASLHKKLFDVDIYIEAVAQLSSVRCPPVLRFFSQRHPGGCRAWLGGKRRFRTILLIHPPIWRNPGAVGLQAARSDAALAMFIAVQSRKKPQALRLRPK